MLEFVDEREDRAGRVGDGAGDVDLVGSVRQLCTGEAGDRGCHDLFPLGNGGCVRVLGWLRRRKQRKGFLDFRVHGF